MVQNNLEEITEILGFVEIRNFIRKSMEAPVRGCSAIDSKENSRGHKHVTLPQ